MDCQDVREQLSEYLDEDALTDLCRVINEHLSGCPNCRVFVDTLKKTIVLYQAGDSEAKIELPVRVTNSLKEVLAREYSRNATGRSD